MKDEDKDKDGCVQSSAALGVPNTLFFRLIDYVVTTQSKHAESLPRT